MNISELMSFGFWFSRVLPMQATTLWIAFGITIGFVIAGLVCFATASKQTGLQAKKFYVMGKYLSILGVLELLWVFAHFERIPVVMQRGWALLILIIVGVTAYHEIKYVWRVLPGKSAGNARQELKAKYLPKRK